VIAPGRWICIDGTEGAGKTTLARALEEETGAEMVAEFSRAPFGRALREAVSASPHFISASPLGQSLVFLGDFVELFEDEIAPELAAGRTVITDRGFLSKLAYQQVVLERSMEAGAARELLVSILGLIPEPELTILLSAPSEVIRERLIERDGECGAERIAFIERAAQVASGAAEDIDLACVRIETDRDRKQVTARALEAIAQLR
jgi:dTMP kinase